MPFTRTIKSALFGCGLAAAMGAIPAALAAKDAPSSQAPLILAQAATYDDETIDAFAAAQGDLEEIQVAYTAQYQEAQTEERRQQINQQATEEMVEAIRDAPGITVEEYNAIIRAANEDPELAQRINDAIADAQL